MVQKFVLSPLKKFWNRLGPGFITGSSDDDPSGVGTYSASGVQFGYSQLWIAWFTVPLMIAVQEMSARIGLVTGRGIVAALKHRIPRWLLIIPVAMLLFANSINIGTDIGAMADASRILFPHASFVWLTILFTIVCVLLQIFVEYKSYVKYLKWLTLSLFAYIAVAFYVHINWSEVLYTTLIPTFAATRDTMLMITAILGTTISPYLMFWQASEEVEEKIVAGKITIAARRELSLNTIRDMRFDISFGMIFSNVVMFFIIATTAAELFGSGAHIDTAADAARVLEPLAGAGAGLLFTLGIIGTGLLAIPVLAGAGSYAVAELLGWRSGLYRKWHEAVGFYGIIALSTVMGLCVNFIGIPPMRALVWTAVINGFVAPFSILLLLIAANDKRVMGRHVNGAWSNIGGIVSLFIMVGAIVMYFVL